MRKLRDLSPEERQACIETHKPALLAKELNINTNAIYMLQYRVGNGKDKINNKNPSYSTNRWNYKQRALSLTRQAHTDPMINVPKDYEVHYYEDYMKMFSKSKW